jgi:hypothetical protein
VSDSNEKSRVDLNKDSAHSVVGRLPKESTDATIIASIFGNTTLGPVPDRMLVVIVIVKRRRDRPLVTRVARKSVNDASSTRRVVDVPRVRAHPLQGGRCVVTTANAIRKGVTKFSPRVCVANVVRTNLRKVVFSVSAVSIDNHGITRVFVTKFLRPTADTVVTVAAIPT